MIIMREIGTVHCTTNLRNNMNVKLSAANLNLVLHS